MSLINTTIPEGSDCTIYEYGSNGSRSESQCDRWTYDDTLYKPSVVMDVSIPRHRAPIRMQVIL